MNPKEEIKKKLEKYPNVKYQEGENSLSILPINKNGFTVKLYETPPTYTVHFEGWHEHFKSKEEALNCLAFGLSESCRLKIIFRGKTPQKWVMEFKEKNEWIEDSETGLIFFPFWRKKTVVYKKNGLIKET